MQEMFSKRNTVPATRIASAIQNTTQAAHAAALDAAWSAVRHAKDDNAFNAAAARLEQLTNA
jgi:hypothetical protein